MPMPNAPVHLGASEAEAWTSGYSSALEACEAIAMERGGADGLIIAGRIRQIIDGNCSHVWQTMRNADHSTCIHCGAYRKNEPLPASDPLYRQP